MHMRILSALMLYLVAVSLNGCLAASDIERAYYADWAEVCDYLGLTWKPYQVKTEDGWYLTMFRITGEVGSQPNYLKDENQDKLPVIM